MSLNNIVSTERFSSPPIYGRSEVGLDETLPAARLLSWGSFVLFLCFALVVLAFIPLVPPVDVLEGGGFTVRGGIEFGLILTGILLLGVYAKAVAAFAFDIRNPAFLLVSLFVFWAVLSSIWSPNPFLTIAKSMELWLITLAAAMSVAIAARLRVASGKLETILALSLVTVIVGLLMANLFIWGMLLPNTGDVSLPLELLDEEASSERPRLILAYAHPLLTGDLLSLTVISVFAASMRRFWKVVLIAALLYLLWLANARGPIGGVIISLGAMCVLKLRRNDVRALVLMLIISACLAVALVVNDALVRLSASLMTDDVSTLNSRTELWKQVFQYILERPVAGCGYYASRYLLVKDFPWAGHAHNSFLETLLTTGLVGLTILMGFMAYLARAILRTRSVLLLGATIYCLIQGMLNPLLFYAGLPMFVIALSVLYADGQQSRPAQGNGLIS